MISYCFSSKKRTGAIILVHAHTSLSIYYFCSSGCYTFFILLLLLIYLLHFCYVSDIFFNYNGPLNSKLYNDVMCLSYSTLAFYFLFAFLPLLVFCCTYCIESILSFSLPNDFDIEIYGEKERTTYGNVKHYGFDYVCPHNGALIYISSPCCSYCWWYFKLFVSRQDHFSTFFFSLSHLFLIYFFISFFFSL